MDGVTLEQVPIFSGLSDSERDLIASRMREVRFEEGASLIERGDLSYKFFIILQGSVEVLRDGLPPVHLGPGEFVGEHGIVTQQRRNAHVIAASPVTAAVAIGWDMRELMEEHPSVRSRILAADAQRTETSS